MSDETLIELFFNRDESAVEMCADHYGRYVNTIARGILRNDEDAKECVNDTWLSVWRAIPPKRPANFRLFLGKITRNLSLDILRQKKAAKRGGGQYETALDELSEILTAQEENSMPEYSDPVADEVIDRQETGALTEYIQDFLRDLPENKRIIFLQRYWYLRSVKEIAEDRNLTESNVKTTLHRIRNDLKCYLEAKGVEI